MAILEERRRALHGNTEEDDVFESIRSRHSSSESIYLRDADDESSWEKGHAMYI